MSEAQTHRYRIEVADQSCDDGEVYVHEFKLDVDRFEIMRAMELLYPELHSFALYIEEIE